MTCNANDFNDGVAAEDELDVKNRSADEIGEDCCDYASLEKIGVTKEDLSMCISVLSRLEAKRDVVNWHSRALRGLRKALAPSLRAVFGNLPQKGELSAKDRAKEEKLRQRERRQRQLEADRKWQNNAKLRASRLAQLQALETSSAQTALALENGDADKSSQICVQTPVRIPDGPVDVDIEDAETDDAEEYARQQACYTCKVRFCKRHHFYSHLCPPCSALNWNKRKQSCDMAGRVCLVTGARVKIGFQTALKLLRMGARVIATTRFPQDAAQRFSAETDAREWSNRLELCGVDFRFLGAVERLCDELHERLPHLDVIINNACQTIRRPACYYQHLRDVENSARAKPLTAGISSTCNGISSFVLSERSAHVVNAVEGSAALSQLQILTEDAMSAEEANSVLPPGEFDVHGQQLDTRAINSWKLKLGEVSTPETVEVFCINVLTPFIINGRLRTLLERSPNPDRYIINVSAMEGKFYRYKQPTHPHTNMAKAAMNMMTRTSAEDLARASGIYMNSVDTGWINDENPLPTAQNIATRHGFQTPIDEVDAAARILDPVVNNILTVNAATATGTSDDFAGAKRRTGGGGGGGSDGPGPTWGRFYKDYEPSEW